MDIVCASPLTPFPDIYPGPNTKPGMICSVLFVSDFVSGRII